MAELGPSYVYGGPLRGSRLVAEEWPEPDPEILLAWRPCDRPLAWKYASMITAILRAPAVHFTPPIGYCALPAHAQKHGVWQVHYDIRDFVFMPYDRSKSYSSNAIYVVAPTTLTPLYMESTWSSVEVRVLGVVVAEDAEEEDVFVPYGAEVFRVPRALGPWTAQQIALSRWEMEVVAEELTR